VYKQKILWDERYDNEPRVPFEVYIPEEAWRKRNYKGNLSAYYWLLQAKLDIGWMHHLYANIIVQLT
jgi:hypothetical protein